MKTIITFLLCFIYYIAACQPFVIKKHQQKIFQNQVRKLHKNPKNVKSIEAVEKLTSNFFYSFNTDFRSDINSENNIDWIKQMNNYKAIDEKLVLANAVIPNSLVINKILLKHNSIKQILADSVYNYSTNLISYNERYKYIEANYLLSNLKTLYPDYKNIDDLILLTQNRGTINVCISVINNSGIDSMENYLLNFINIDSLNLASKWVKYSLCDSYNTDFYVTFTINHIVLSPEKIFTFNYPKIKFRNDDNIIYKQCSEFHYNGNFKYNNMKILPNYYTRNYIKYLVEKDVTLSGNISFKKNSSAQFTINRPFVVKTIFNYKWDEKYGNLLKQNPDILPSNDEMITSVFKQFRKVIDKENILTAL